MARSSFKIARSARRSGQCIIAGVFKILAGVGVLTAIVYFVRQGGNFGSPESKSAPLIDDHSPDEATLALCGRSTNDGHAIPFEMVYSDDKRQWIEFAADRFSRLCPNIQVKLTALPDIDAADAILSGRMSPTLWAPTDELALRYLEHRWKERGIRPPFNLAEKTELVRSPLVVLMWQDRLRVLSAILRKERSDEGIWMRAFCPRIPREPDLAGIPIEQMKPGSWSNWYSSLIAAPDLLKGKAVKPAVLPSISRGEPLPSLEELETWGRVKLGHAKPTRDSAGVGALFLMSYDYVLPPQERTAQADTKEPGAAHTSPQTREQNLVHRFESAFAKRKTGLGQWLRRCEAGLDSPPKNAQVLTSAIFSLGPEVYDGVVTYEHLALPFLDRVDVHGDALHKLVIVYSEPMLLAGHPAVVFDDRPERQEVARRWLRFLLSQPMQEKAIEWGFRPVNPAVTLSGYDVEQNRFLRLRRYGVLIQPSWQEAPRISGHTIQELMALWAEATGRN